MQNTQIYGKIKKVHERNSSKQNITTQAIMNWANYL